MLIPISNRRNIHLNVVRTPSEQAKRDQLVEVIQSNAGSGIVYVANPHTADELRGFLFTKRIAAARFHEKMKVKDRHSIREGFVRGRFRILLVTRKVRTELKKSDIRFVVHYQFPACLETYAEETAQAGLDGGVTAAYLFYRLEDKRAQSPFSIERYPLREESISVYDGLQGLIKKNGKTAIPLGQVFKESGLSEQRYRVVLAQLEAAGIIKRGRGVRSQRLFHTDQELDQDLRRYEAQYQLQRDNLNAVMRYAQSSDCRVDFLNTYFGSFASKPCGICDNCQLYRNAQGQLFPLSDLAIAS
jgi:ATP-dependent DNA helicase RecQ